MAYPTRKIGTDPVSAIGFGAMGLSSQYGAVEPDEERFKTLDAAFERGIRFWDTANAYGDSEVLLGRWLKRTGKRDEIFLATKFGFVLDRVTKNGVDGSPQNVAESAEKALEHLGVDYIDLFYLHRPDPEVPIEITVGAMAQLVELGKVKYLGLSECTPDTLRRANAIHPISVVQLEYSVFELGIEENDVLKTARELGIVVVAYSPLGRGLLTGRYKSPDDFAEDDFRRTLPKFSKENFPKILKVVEELQTIGREYGATAGQVALAWLLEQGVIPIPGTKSIKYLEENLAAAHIALKPEAVQKIRELAEEAEFHGERYGGFMSSLSFVDTPPL